MIPNTPPRTAPAQGPRALIKLSGESLAGSNADKRGIDDEYVTKLCTMIKKIHDNLLIVSDNLLGQIQDLDRINAGIEILGNDR